MRGSPGDPDWPDAYDAGDIRYSSISLSTSRDKTYSVGSVHRRPA
jgi:hypothetical protein